MITITIAGCAETAIPAEAAVADHLKCMYFAYEVISRSRQNGYKNNAFIFIPGIAAAGSEWKYGVGRLRKTSYTLIARSAGNCNYSECSLNAFFALN